MLGIFMHGNNKSLPSIRRTAVTLLLNSVTAMTSRDDAYCAHESERGTESIFALIWLNIYGRIPLLVEALQMQFSLHAAKCIVHKSFISHNHSLNLFYPIEKYS